MEIVIVGNGIAGVTAARYVRSRSAEARVTLVSDESPVHLARTALMYVYMGTLSRPQLRPYADAFWTDNRIRLVHARALGLDAEARQIHLEGHAPLPFDRLLIATGSVPQFYDWPGQDLGGVQGLYHLGDLDRMEADTRGVRRALVVGGGLIGVEMAEMLRTRGIGVALLVRESRYLARVLPEAEARLVEAEIRRHGVDLRLETGLESLEGDDGERVRSALTTRGETLEAEWVGLATGVRPNVAWLEGSGVETRRGVLVDDCLETSAPGVFAAGDCAEHRAPPPGRPSVEALWYTGRIQGATAAFGLIGSPRPYRPGVFFNSAKFFGLEWQTYGRLDPEPPPGEAHHVLAAGGRMLRVQHEAEGGQAVVGLHGLGVRLRQDVCARWIAGRSPLGEVLEGLRRARFDAEFEPWAFKASAKGSPDLRRPPLSTASPRRGLNPSAGPSAQGLSPQPEA